MRGREGSNLDAKAPDLRASSVVDVEVDASSEGKR
jgi:hypothetical protein